MRLGPITYKSNKFEHICNDCLCGIVEMKMDFKVRGLEWGTRSRDIGLGDQ